MNHDPDRIYGTTILAVRRNGRVAVGGDGQVTLGQSVMKSNARKVRRLYGGKVLAGFAGGTADAFTLFERFEASWRNSATSRAPPSNWQRTGAATAAFVVWRPCSASPMPKAPT